MNFMQASCSFMQAGNDLDKSRERVRRTTNNLTRVPELNRRVRMEDKDRNKDCYGDKDLNNEWNKVADNSGGVP